jgi:uncharacterized hydantoinase/oxoprolinase family protein
MVCADRETCSERAIRKLALQIHRRQLRLLRRAVTCVSASLGRAPAVAVTAGSGEFLATKLFANWPDPPVRRVSLAESLGPTISECACAYAVATLAMERMEDGR